MGERRVEKLIAAAMIVLLAGLAVPVSVDAAVWKQNRTGWRYLDDNGRYAKNGWRLIRWVWYHFDARGYMQTGWVQDGNFWYYLDDSGAMQTGWVWDGAHWYYMDGSGAMQTGWVWDGAHWYYMDGSGAMRTGWVWDGAHWYYMDGSGAMQTGWVWDGTHWYYLDDSGVMLTGCQRVDEKIYELAESGAWTGRQYDFMQQEQLGLTAEEVSVVIPGLKQDYTFLWLSDLHIIAGTEEVSPQYKSIVQERMQSFSTKTGVQSARLWQELPEVLDEYGADAVLLGGDIVDFASQQNLECLKKGLDEMDTPWLYVRADHDMDLGYNSLQDADLVDEWQKNIDGDPEVPCLELKDLCVVGINNSTSQLTGTALEQVGNIYAKGKQIILVTHVPLDSQIDPSLGQLSQGVWQGRKLMWGSNCIYKPNTVTQGLLDLVYAKNSQIRSVLCGHLHTSWNGNLTETMGEHVFAPSYSGNIGIVHVRGKEE